MSKSKQIKHYLAGQRYWEVFVIKASETVTRACEIMEKNEGYSFGNNCGIKMSKTKLVFILNPDVRLQNNTLEELDQVSNKIKDLGLGNDLINHKGLTLGMLVTLGEQKILSLTDFADLASDELTGVYDVIKGERVKIKGYLEDFALSKNEADELIMSARNKIYQD